MPYIKQVDRYVLDTYINNLVKAIKTLEKDNIDGNLNYVITRILIKSQELDTKPSYKKLNAVAGVLSCVNTEISRRITAQYEDLKKAENGDILGL